MEYYDGRLCVRPSELFENGIVTESNYRNWINRDRVEVARRGGGSKDSYALIVLDSLPDKYRAKAEEVLGNGDEVLVAGWFRENYQLDQAAVKFSLTGHPSIRATRRPLRRRVNMQSTPR